MQHYFLIALILLMLAGCKTTPNNNAVNTADTNKASKQVLDYSKSDADYQAIVARIKAATASQQDMDDIIRIYPLTSLYQPNSSQEQASKLLSQNYMQTQQWQQCIDINNNLLKLNYTSLTGHYGAAMCATQMGNIALGEYHRRVLDSFIEAIWRTGNGKTPLTPLFITSANDLYAFVQLHQMVATGHALEYVNDLPVQAITVLNPENKRSQIWYFDVTSQFRRGLIDKIESAH